MVRVKLCGLMSESDLAAAVAGGADALGLVTEYPISVPWNLSRERARELAAAAPPFVTTTAVVGGPVAEMVAIAHAVRPHFLQLHGDETLEEIEETCRALAGTGIKVLKALRVDVDSGQALFRLPDPLEAALALSQSGVHGLVVDSKTSHRPAGTGVALDWSLVARIAHSLPVPFILAGGLTPENVAEAVERVRPYGVDVISGVESEAGVKDPDRMRRFVRAAKGWPGKGGT